MHLEQLVEENNYHFLYVDNTPRVVMGSQSPKNPVSKSGPGFISFSIQFDRVVKNDNNGYFSIFLILLFWSFISCSPLSFSGPFFHLALMFLSFQLPPYSHPHFLILIILLFLLSCVSLCINVFGFGFALLLVLCRQLHLHIHAYHTPPNLIVLLFISFFSSSLSPPTEISSHLGPGHLKIGINLRWSSSFL